MAKWAQDRKTGLLVPGRYKQRGFFTMGPAVAGGNAANPTAVSILNKLGSWWELNEASGTRTDSKGANNLAPAGTVTSANGVRGSLDPAANFGGVGNLFIASNASLQVPLAQDSFCLFGWFYVNATGTVQYLMSKWNNTNSTAMDYDIAYNTTFSQGQSGGTAYCTAQSVGFPTAAAWHFYVAWLDTSDKKMRFQIDNGTIYVSPTVSTVTPQASPFNIGSCNNTFRLTGRGQRCGWIKSDFLSPTERTYLYNSGNSITYNELVAAAGATTNYSSYIAAVNADSPTALWLLNETSGTAAADSSGNGNAATYNNSPTLRSSGVVLNGTNQCVTANSATPFSYVGAASQSYAFEAFVNTATALAVLSAIVDKTNTAGNLWNLLQMSTAQNAQVQIYNGSTNPIIASASGSVPAGSFHQIVMNRNAVSQQLELYIDGAFIGQAACANTINSSNAIAPCIGARQAGTDRFLAAQVRCVSIYPTALSAARVLAHWNARPI